MLVLETYADNVYVESPPSELPRQLDANFRRAKIPASKSDCQRQIFLRPRDTVVFDNEACAILVSVGISPDSSDNRPVAAADDIQVKSSAQQSTDAGGGAHPDAVMKDDETEDEDDLDAPMANTPDGVDPNTPATSRSTDGPAVKETPSKRPGSHEKLLQTILIRIKMPMTQTTPPRTARASRSERQLRSNRMVMTLSMSSSTKPKSKPLMARRVTKLRRSRQAPSSQAKKKQVHAPLQNVPTPAMTNLTVWPRSSVRWPKNPST